MTPTLELCAYRHGDLARLRNTSFDPFEVLGADVESSVGGLRSIMCDGKLVACIGWAPFMVGVVGSFAAVDRLQAAGHGTKLVAIIRAQIDVWAIESGAHRIEATCDPEDRAAQVFLRAMGYTFECRLEAAAPDATDLLQFKLIKRR